jgi:hypothetical protein
MKTRNNRVSADEAADVVLLVVEVGMMRDGVGKSDGVGSGGDVSTGRVDESWSEMSVVPPD